MRQPVECRKSIAPLSAPPEEEYRARSEGAVAAAAEAEVVAACQKGVLQIPVAVRSEMKCGTMDGGGAVHDVIVLAQRCAPPECQGVSWRPTSFAGERKINPIILCSFSSGARPSPDPFRKGSGASGGQSGTS